jgi:hypothetical protein
MAGSLDRRHDNEGAEGIDDLPEMLDAREFGRRNVPAGRMQQNRYARRACRRSEKCKVIYTVRMNDVRSDLFEKSSKNRIPRLTVFPKPMRPVMPGDWRAVPADPDQMGLERAVECAARIVCGRQIG